MKRKIKIGIIGAGGIAQYAHIPTYKKAENVEITSIADTNAEKLKYASQKFDIPKTFTNWEDMLNEDIDAVSICTPNIFHSIQSIKAMEAGKHVLCEKPLCLTEQEVEDVFNTSEKTKMKFMGAMPKRYSGEAQIMKKLIENGHFGEIYYMKASYMRRRGIPGLNTWFTNKKLAGGGPMMDLGVHIIDFLIYLTGIFNPVTVFGTTYSKFFDSTTDGGWPPLDTRIGNKFIEEVNVEDLSSGFVKFANGATLFVETSWAGNCETGTKISILGTKAGAQLPDPENAKNPIKIFGDIEEVLSDIIPTIPQTKAFDEEINHFLKCVREDVDTGTKKDEILTVTRIIDGIYRSAESGKPIMY